MNPAEQLPEYDITDDVNESARSGIQEKITLSDIEPGEHTQELQEGDTPEDAIEILNFTLKEAQKNEQPMAIITCVQKEDLACKTLRDELDRRVERGSIKSYEEKEIDQRIGFVITLNREESLDEAA